MILLIFVSLLLTACGMDFGSVLPDPADGNGDNPDLSGPAGTAAVEDGEADLDYTFRVDSLPVTKILLEPRIPLVIDESEGDGPFVVSGIAEDRAYVKMQGKGGPTETCYVECDIPVRIAVDGMLKYDDVNNNCMMPLTITLAPQEDESIITGDCPAEALEMIDCPAFLAMMIDVSTYTFTKEIREIDQPTAAGVVMRGKLENVVFPLKIQGLCEW
jgi:hypothetical protein